MAEFRTSKFTFEPQRCDSKNAMVTLYITFTTKDDLYYPTSLLSNITAEYVGLKVQRWGKLKWEYDLEDMLLVPGEASLEIADYNGMLKSYFFGDEISHNGETVANYFDMKAKVEIKINGSTEYIGYIQEDNISYNSDEQKVTFGVDPNTQILNLKRLFDDNNKPVNPLAWTTGLRSIKSMLGDIFRLVNPSITDANVEIYHDWVLEAKDYYGNIEEKNFSDISVHAEDYYNNKDNGLSNVGDMLKKIAIDWCCFTGMVHAGRPFFKKLYSYGVSGTQTLGTVQSRNHSYRFGTIDYVRVETGSDYVTNFIYERGTNTNLEGRSITRNIISGFYPAGEKEYPVPQESDVACFIEGVLHLVYRAKDPNLYSNAYKSNGELIAEFWYKNRSDIKKNRIDTILVDGVQYDFLKDFIDDGKKYQPIGLTKDLDNGLSEFQALYMGEA